MYYIWVIGAMFVQLVWLFMTLLGLPGNWLMIGTTLLFMWWYGDVRAYATWALVLLVLLGVLGEVLEFLLGAVGSRKAGGSIFAAGMSILFSIIGGVVGTFALPIPVVGTLVGACAGAFAGSVLGDVAVGRSPVVAMQAGRGAAVGRFLGTVAKVLVGVVIFFYAMVLLLIARPVVG